MLLNFLKCLVSCHLTQHSFNAGKELEDPRVLTDVGDVPVQELRDCGINDDKLMNIISESVKLVMEEVSHTSSYYLQAFALTHKCIFITNIKSVYFLHNV